MDSFERQTQRAFDGCFFGLLGLIIGLTIRLISLAIGGLIGLVVKGAEKNPEDELRNLKKPLYLSKQIYGKACPHCKTLNEEHKTHCYMCGLALVEKREAVSGSYVFTGYQLAFGVLVLLLIIYGAVRNYSQTRPSNVQAANQTNNEVVNIPVAMSDTEEKALISAYLADVTRLGCNFAVSKHMLVVDRNFIKECEGGSFKVYNVSEISHQRELGEDTTVYLVKGRVRVGEGIYKSLNFQVSEGKIKSFKPVEESREATPQPTSTPTTTPEPPLSQTFRIFLTTYFNARMQGDCEQAWKLIHDQEVNKEKYITACKGDGLLTSYRLETVSVIDDRTRIMIRVTGEFNYQGLSTQTKGEYWISSTVNRVEEILNGSLGIERLLTEGLFVGYCVSGCLKEHGGGGF